MLQFFKKMGKYIKIVFFIAYVVFFLLLILVVAASIIATLNDKEALVDPAIINRLSLIAILFSLPSLFDTITEIVPKKNNKNNKKIKLEGQCPNCFEKFAYYYKEDQ